MAMDLFIYLLWNSIFHEDDLLSPNIFTNSSEDLVMR